MVGWMDGEVVGDDEDECDEWQNTYDEAARTYKTKQ